MLLICHFVLAVILYCANVLCQQNPTISFISKEKVVDIGDTVELNCVVAYSKDYPVVWTKINRVNPNNYLFISRGSSVVVPEPRYNVRLEERQSMYVLTISKIQEIDAGPYQCEIITGTSSKVTAIVDVSREMS